MAVAVVAVAVAVASTAVRVLRVGWLMKLRPRRRPLLVHWARKLPPSRLRNRLYARIRARAEEQYNNIMYTHARAHALQVAAHV